ncbi:hypothetical protein F2P81_012138 [Scophthalmus maximus]|uniref:Uncharacterized protein n=1 Tax=Scophthalmus maximus TaxID=52904 RepID=A0A6A4SR58_SCOMX|nr:hypothetical protein F2P81_012138 [Scophthalmus maximus]
MEDLVRSCGSRFAPRSFRREAAGCLDAPSEQSKPIVSTAALHKGEVERERNECETCGVESDMMDMEFAIMGRLMTRDDT